MLDDFIQSLYNESHVMSTSLEISFGIRGVQMFVCLFLFIYINLGKGSWPEKKIIQSFLHWINHTFFYCFWVLALRPCFSKFEKMIYILEPTTQNLFNPVISQCVRLSVCFMNCSETVPLSHTLTIGAAMFILSHYSQWTCVCTRACHLSQTVSSIPSWLLSLFTICVNMSV